MGNEANLACAALDYELNKEAHARAFSDGKLFEEVMEPVYISNMPSARCYANSLFGIMVKLAKGVESYHGDLYHDAMVIHGVEDNFGVGSEVIWLPHRDGTHICIDTDGFPSDFVPSWYPGSVPNRFIGTTFRFKIVSIRNLKHWTVDLFVGGE